MIKEKSSAKDISIKIGKINGYVRKTERRIQMHEKALTRLRKKYRQELERLSKTMKGLVSKLKVRA